MKKYQVDRKGLLVVIEELKQRLTAKAAKMRRYEQRIHQYRQNRLFSTDQKRFYQELDGGIKYDTAVPDAEESLRFWSDIWDNGGQHHNNDAEWLRNLKEEPNKAGPKQENISITAKQVTKQCQKMPNWKAPGPDRVQGFWLKKITSCHERIAIQLNSPLNEEATLPLWVTLSKTILCQKDPKKGTKVSNFRPISFLPLMWKLMTSILADSMYAYLDENSLLPSKQKGCKKKSWGTKDQLLIDQMVLRDCKRRHTNLAMAWVDYRKTYDMVPHSGIVECMEMFCIAEKVKAFLTGSMNNWKAKQTSSGEYLGPVNVKRGIF